MDDQPADSGGRIYRAPELIGKRWYHIVEITDPDERVTPYGPFESRQAAQAHQDKMIAESGKNSKTWPRRKRDHYAT